MASLSWARVMKRSLSNLQQQASAQWENPQIGWFKLNMDSGVDIKSSRAITDGLVRCPKGDWVFGYGRNIGVRSVLEVELQALVDGLKMT
ncbi:hypothetical protein GOBAR_AA28306 [Gossypium barbadense]|uniref:RNase H type-1 domain-containing protein n=1 Tax=Gossypium barbadense TaxID=3634 RepID=A0A2P5WMP6_GOSBA|nr:hypothetical protein GOBAR_AA28306 [Gossypium barbadense]